MDMPATSLVSQALSLSLREADLCVQCGLCLPHCPTYRLTRDENESPRGRIQLMRALARDQLPLTPRLEAHLERCLACRACEAICPARVPYGRLLDTTRARIARTRGTSPWRRRLMNLAARPERSGAAFALARLYQRSGFQTLARRTGILRWLDLARFDSALPELHRARTWQTFYPATGAARGDIALFLGCIARTFDAATIDAAIFVLNRFGYDVHVPAGQSCCGALHQHAGDPGMAHTLAQKNRHAFRDTPDTVIYLASGCGAMLTEHPETLHSHPQDFCGFLTGIRELPPLRVAGPLTVAVHEPCTQRNVLRDADAPYRLLGHVKGLTVIPLEGNGVCCGGAGSYFLEQPEISDQLRADKLAAIERANVRTVVTGNFGCALHLGASLRAQGLDVELIHPAVLLRRIIEGHAA